MDKHEYVLMLFQDGSLCDCIKSPVWDRIYDADNNFIGYELQHKSDCLGRIKAAEVLRELDEQIWYKRDRSWNPKAL